MSKINGKSTEESLPATVSAAALALLSGYTDRQVRNLASEGIVIKAGRGRFELASSIKNILMRAEARGADEGTEVRTGYLRARKEALELATAERRRDLMPASEVQDTMDFCWAAIRDALVGFPARLTRDPVERRRFEIAVDELRNQIAAQIEKTAAQFQPNAAAMPVKDNEEEGDE